MLINLTPHEINLIHDDNHIDTYPSVGLAKLTEPLPQTEGTVTIGDREFPTATPPQYGKVEFGVDIPDDCPGIIVSGMVGEWIAKNLPDIPCPVFAPDTSPVGAVRNERGQVVGTKRLHKWI